MNEDKIIQKLFEHDKRFDTLTGEVQEFKHQVLTAQDEMMVILRRLDQERVFTNVWISRMEKEMEEHRQELTKIKHALKI